MYIAIIDDEYEFVEIIKDVMIDLLLNQNYVIQTYQDAQEFIIANKEVHYDVILLDCNLSNGTGYDILDILKGSNTKSIVILITSNENAEIMRKAFDYRIFGYVWKSHLYDQMEKLIPKVLLEYDNMHEMIKIKTSREYHQIKLEDIYGLYSEKHYIIYQLSDTYISSRDSFKSLMPYYLNKEFVQIERNTLINLYHVASFTHEWVKMDDDKLFHLGHKYYKNLQKAFINTKV